VIKVVVVCMV